MKIVLCRSNGSWGLYDTWYLLGLNAYEKEGKLFSKFWINLTPLYYWKHWTKYGFIYQIRNRFQRFCFKIRNPDIWFLESSILPNKIYFSF